MRTQNLKFICALLFAIVFLVGGFLVGTSKVSAEEKASSFPYSLSSVYSYPNTVGGVTTVVKIGCVPGSGDKYDINTGILCPYSVPGARIACAKGSSHKYDVNTGKLCVYLESNVMIGCASTSNHKYDINTGKLCVNNKQANKTPGIIITRGTTTGSPGKTVLTVDPVITETELIKDSIVKDSVTDEDIKDIGNSLTASGGKIGSLFAWPMSTQAITLVIVLILGIGYGIYSFTRKDKEELVYTEPKSKNKEEVKPIVTTSQNKPNSQPTPAPTNPEPVKTPEKTVAQNANIVPENKTPNTPATNTVTNTQTGPVNQNPQSPSTQK